MDTTLKKILLAFDTYEPNTLYSFVLFELFRPNCFQIVVQHFSEEQYIFYFAGETPEQAQVMRLISLFCASAFRMLPLQWLFLPDCSFLSLIC